ncbi:ATP-binding protein [Ramlibacter sp. 2FC]|uniref:sensor histidine kinase n=1 Tax=Ramlibacter sp. 2FC TaxID=2502188 RepID=UPI0010F94F3A|nr:ATP-binding protein [Ramlibacter sp. 2FC]
MRWPYLLITAIAAVQAVLLLTWSLWGWHKSRSLVDKALAWAATFWIVHLLLSPETGLLLPGADAVLLTHLGYQGLVAAVSYFLLVSAMAHDRKLHAIWWLQGAIGVAALGWYYGAVAGPGRDQAYLVWKLANGAGAAALTGVVLVRAFWGHMQRHSMVVGAGIIGLGICISDLLQAEGHMLGVPLRHHFYALYLMVMWLFVTGRAGTAQARGQGQAALADKPANANDAAEAVSHERHRIAQDLHDGVGSQLVNILSSLDSHNPQQQALALALENCLVDLKIMVDSIDGTQDSVTDVLARLRYRVQHSLDKLGITMVWNVEFNDALESLRGETAGQVLRIAQEALSNVMRHSGASRVEVACRVDGATQSLCLEVRDNGRGGADEAAAANGKGLLGMQRRAALIGGHLQIESPPGEGTRLELCVPLAQASRGM